MEENFVNRLRCLCKVRTRCCKPVCVWVFDEPTSIPVKSKSRVFQSDLHKNTISFSATELPIYTSQYPVSNRIEPLSTLQSHGPWTSVTLIQEYRCNTQRINIHNIICYEKNQCVRGKWSQSLKNCGFMSSNNLIINFLNIS